MSYAVTVDTSQPEDSPALDPLQRAGVVHLLREGLDAVESIEDETGQVVEITDHFIGVHPDGALLRVFVDAPRLEDAEAAVEAVMGEVLRHTELLAQWTVDRCEVELHLDLAEESFRSAGSPDAAAAKPEARARARAHRAPGGTGTGAGADAGAGAASGVTDVEAHEEDMRAAISALAPRLAGVALASFGPATAEAELAAGALVYSIDVLIDELFEDVAALDGSPSAAECTDGLLQLEGLPWGFAHLYTPLFARRLLVAAVTLTDRLCRPGFARLGCVAEELLLRLLLETAEATLDLHGLLHRGVHEALDAVRDSLCDEIGHAWPSAPAMDDIPDVADWFTPLDAGRPSHPYTVEP
ncbi:hypothetical protein [Streptacidiphilus neutrinimicus]|uniref:hypothetical protein n=1 Tax=Streptacidiphilus neutrinimicus TaxID=105420 RepID=UPI0005A6254E|nr:hypothetical protein [Streptacidiphilus neutrinimicus]